MYAIPMLAKMGEVVLFNMESQFVIVLMDIQEKTASVVSLRFKGLNVDYIYPYYDIFMHLNRNESTSFFCYQN